MSRALRFVRNAIRPGVDVTKAPAGIRVEWNVPVIVRDGTTLRVNVFRPSGDAPVPVIMSAHPYGKDKIPAKSRSGRAPAIQSRLLPQPHRISISEWTSWEAPDPVIWVTQGYAVVNADLRGGGTSEGVADLFSDQEARDYYDLIEWAGTQEWSSGRVGLDGVSYLAISQYKVAALHPPHLAAICPWEGLSDIYRDFARPGGVREDGFSILWSALTSREARVHSPIRKQFVARPQRDDWYRSVTPDVSRIDVPMLVCGSFSDHCLHSRGSFEIFCRAGSARKWLYTHRDGKWSAYYGAEATRARQRFFDYTLKGLDNGWASEPAVRLAISDGGPEPAEVVRESAWPPSDIALRTLRLDSRTGSLLLGSTPQTHATVTFDTRRRREKAAFVFTLPTDTDVIGPMALHLFVELRGAEDAFLFANVRKIRAGREVTFEGSYGFSGDSVSKGWQRAAHRELDLELSTPLQPVHRHERVEPLCAGEIALVQIALLPHATRFRRGDLLRVEIRGTWPVARDPFRGQFPAGYERSPKASCTLHTGGAFDAHLLVGTRRYASGSSPESQSTEGRA
jgi:predicted acyl esterase